MNTVNQLEAGFWNLLEAFQTVSVELARFKDVSQVTAPAPVPNTMDASWNKFTSMRLRPLQHRCVQPLRAGGKMLGVIGVVGAAGYSTGQRRAFAVSANQVAGAVDKARGRFAGELHDDALEKLTAAELRPQKILDPDGKDGEKLREIQPLLAQTEDALRRLLFEVRPPALEIPGGFEETIRDRGAMLHSLTGIEAKLDLELPDELPYEFAEALTNVERHAAATRVQVSVKSVDGAIHGLVIDNGRGFVVSKRDHLPGHLGLLALNERSLLAGGWTKIESEPGVGTKVEFWMPTS